MQQLKTYFFKSKSRDKTYQPRWIKENGLAPLVKKDKIWGRSFTIRKKGASQARVGVSHTLEHPMLCSTHPRTHSKQGGVLIG